MSKKEKSLNRGVYICVLLACLVPRYISTFKIHIGLNISLFTIAVLITWVVFSRRFHIKTKLEGHFFFIWFFAVIASLWRAEKMGVWAYYVIWTATAFLFQQILFEGNKDHEIRIAIRALVDALFLHLLIGLIEITTHTYLFEIGDYFRGRLYGHVAISIFHNLNDYATFVTTLFPFAIFEMVNCRGIVRKVYYGFITITSVFLIIRSESRAAILTCILFLGVLFFLYAKQSVNKGTLALFALGLVIFVILTVPTMQKYITGVLRRNTIDVNSNSDTARINLIKNGLYFLIATYGFGVGAGNLYEWLATRSIYPIGTLRFIHNWYVEVLATFGIAFFLVYIIFHGKILYKLIKMTGKSGRFWSMNNAILISFIGFSVVSISSSSNVYSEWVWMYLALIATYTLLYYKGLRKG